MSEVKVKLFDHLSCTATVKFKGTNCHAYCTFFSSPQDNPRCTLFNTSLSKQNEADSLNRTQFKRNGHCINTMRDQLAELNDEPRCSVVVQRNFEKSGVDDQYPKLTSYEVELNTVLRGYNEFRLTLTNDDPTGSSMSAIANPANPTVVAPIILDLGNSEDEDA